MNSERKMQPKAPSSIPIVANVEIKFLYESRLVGLVGGMTIFFGAEMANNSST